MRQAVRYAVKQATLKRRELDRERGVGIDRDETSCVGDADIMGVGGKRSKYKTNSKYKKHNVMLFPIARPFDVPAVAKVFYMLAEELNKDGKYNKKRQRF